MGLSQAVAVLAEVFHAAYFLIWKSFCEVVQLFLRTKPARNPEF